MNSFGRCFALAACAVAMTSFPPARAAAQAASSVTITTRVVDSADAPVPGADVSIIRGLSTVLAHATTDAAGHARLTVPRSAESLQLVARRIGYQPRYRFFALAAANSMSLDVSLQRAATTLETVKVSATEDLRRKSYHLDADDIANSSRAMIDGTDVFKLRPDMMNSRGGAQACAIPWTDHDGWIENVWVNGRRIVMPVIDDSAYLAARRVALGASKPPPRPNPRLSRVGEPPKPLPSPFTQYSHLDTVLSVLRSIKPEHIAEVTYHDCLDTSINAVRSDMALFVVLKPGIGYKEGVGSYVVAGEPTRATTSVAHSALDSLPRYRLRLLGIFDSATGDALPGVDVIDTLSGTRSTTAASGVISLFFLPEGLRPLRLRREGFRDTVVDVTISPVDTVPLTLVLERKPPER